MYQNDKPHNYLREQNARTAYMSANLLQVGGLLLCFASVLAGIVIAAQQGSEDLYDEGSHPYVGLRVGVGVGGLFFAGAIFVFASYIKWKTSDEGAGVQSRPNPFREQRLRSNDASNGTDPLISHQY
jgi:hypothetical protein